MMAGRRSGLDNRQHVDERREEHSLAHTALMFATGMSQKCINLSGNTLDGSDILR